MDNVRTPARRTLVLVGAFALLATVLVAAPPANAVHPIEVVVSAVNDNECAEDGSDNVFEFVVELRDGTFDQETPADREVTVKFETIADGTATEGADYTFASGTVTISPPFSSGTADVTVKCDAVLAEPEETFSVFFFDLEGASFQGGGSDRKVTGSIQEGGTAPPGPELFITDSTPPTVTEGDSSTDEISVTFKVTLSEPCMIACTVQYTTVNGTATAGTNNDYDSTNGTLRWPDPDPTIGSDPDRTITVTINGDSTAEPTEDFTVELSNALGGADIKDGVGRAVIIDDDASKVSVNDGTSSEGDGTHAIPFVIDQPVDSDIYVVWHTLDGSAKDGSDYTGKPSGAVTEIPASASGANGSISLIDNETVESFEERFYVEIDCIENDNDTNCDDPFDSSVASTGDTFGQQTIEDDDPKVNVGNASAGEGNDIAFPVSLSAPRDDQDTTVRVKTADGTAKAGDDYTAKDITLTFPAGSTTPSDDADNGVSGGKVSVETIEDTDEEPNETFTLAPVEADGAGLGTTGTGTINDDEDPNNPEVVADAGDDRTVDSYQLVSFDGSFSGGTPPVSYRWNFGDGSPEADGEKVSHRFTREDTYTVVLTVTDDTGKTDTDEVLVTVTDSGEVLRSFGVGRIETALDVSRDHWNRSNTVVMATAFNFPDGLAAGGLASELGAPLLLTEHAELRDDIAAELTRLKAKKVILLGGENAISATVQEDLEDRGYEVDRVAKPTRFGTAADIARLVGATPKGEVLLALGQSPDGQQVAWADALAAGAFAGLDEVPPTLLTRRDTLPEQTKTALSDLGAKKVFILGGSAAVSDAVEQKLKDLGYAVERLGGATRYETSAIVAGKALGMYPPGQLRLVFVTGAKYPDGLTGGSLAGQVDGQVVLVPTSDLNNTPKVRNFVEGGAQRFDLGTVVGGDKVVSETVRQQLEQAMEG